MTRQSQEIASTYERTRNDSSYQALYGSIQGSTYEDLRKESAVFISSLDFDGIALAERLSAKGKKIWQKCSGG